MGPQGTLAGREVRQATERCPLPARRSADVISDATQIAAHETLEAGHNVASKRTFSHERGRD